MEASENVVVKSNLTLINVGEAVPSKNARQILIGKLQFAFLIVTISRYMVDTSFAHYGQPHKGSQQVKTTKKPCYNLQNS